MQTGTLVLECRRCARVRVRGRWRYDRQAQPVLRTASRVYCPDCCREALAELFQRSLEADGAAWPAVAAPAVTAGREG